MAKRLTDTDKWKKEWFRELKPTQKLFWYYILDDCDIAGIWDVDFGTACFKTGARLDPEDLQNALSRHIKIIDEGKRWFILDFIRFQYGCDIGELSQHSPVQKGVLAVLTRRGIDRVSIGYKKAIQSIKDKNMNKNMNKDKNKDREAWFEEDWATYPRRIGKKQALRHYLASVNTPEDRARLQTALANYTAKLKAENTEEKFIQHGSTWFNNWQDWVNVKSEQKTIWPTEVVL